jgi:hypothetical protein
MIPHKQNAIIKHIILEAFYNKHVSRGRVVIDIDIVFKILKKTFR